MASIERTAVITVSEAAALLGIGRGLAYQLAHQFLETGGRAGLPVLRLGRRLVVPRHQLDRLLLGETVLGSADTRSGSSPVLHDVPHAR